MRASVCFMGLIAHARGVFVSNERWQQLMHDLASDTDKLMALDTTNLSYTFLALHMTLQKQSGALIRNETRALRQSLFWLTTYIRVDAMA